MKTMRARVTPGTSAPGFLKSKGQLDKLGKKLRLELKGCTIVHATVTEEREQEIRKMPEGA